MLSDDAFVPQDVGKNKTKLSPLAHAVRFAMRCGITSIWQLSAELQCSRRSIYRALKQLKDGDTTVTIMERADARSDTSVTAQNTEGDTSVTNQDTVVPFPRARVVIPACARAQIEPSSKVLSYEEVEERKKDTPLLISPQTSDVEPKGRVVGASTSEDLFSPSGGEDQITEEKKSKPPRSKTKKPVNRGKRLSPDWTLPDEWASWAKVNVTDDEAAIMDQADQFRDYWIAQPGQKGVKLDWQATWRNWMRRARLRRPSNGFSRGGQPQVSSPMADIVARMKAKRSEAPHV